jgi:hypothetical protein
VLVERYACTILCVSRYSSERFLRNNACVRSIVAPDLLGRFGTVEQLADVIVRKLDSPLPFNMDQQLKDLFNILTISVRDFSPDGLHLLQRIDMTDLQFRPNHRLLAEMERLKELDRGNSWVRRQ